MIQNEQCVGLCITIRVPSEDSKVLFSKILDFFENIDVERRLFFIYLESETETFIDCLLIGMHSF